MMDERGVIQNIKDACLVGIVVAVSLCFAGGICIELLKIVRLIFGGIRWLV